MRLSMSLYFFCCHFPKPHHSRLSSLCAAMRQLMVAGTRVANKAIDRSI